MRSNAPAGTSGQTSEIGSSGRIRRFVPLYLNRSKRVCLGNQANSDTTRVDFFSAVCWQFCWHSGRAPITLDEVDLTAPPHIVDAARYLAGRGITLSGVTAGKQSVIAYGEAAVDSPGARMSPMTAKVGPLHDKSGTFLFKLCRFRRTPVSF